MFIPGGNPRYQESSTFCCSGRKPKNPEETLNCMINLMSLGAIRQQWYLSIHSFFLFLVSFFSQYVVHYIIRNAHQLHQENAILFSWTGPLQLWYWWQRGDRVWFHLIHFPRAEQSFYWSLSERLQHLHKSISGAEPKHEYEYPEEASMLQAVKALHTFSFSLQVNKLPGKKRPKCIVGERQNQGEKPRELLSRECFCLLM